MRLISLVITLLIIGFMVARQQEESTAEQALPKSVSDPTQLKIPTQPKDLQEFEKNVNDLIQNQAEETARRVREAEK